MSKLGYLCLAAVPVVCFAIGCAKGLEPTPVQAILRVNRDRFVGSSSDFRIHLESHATMLTSGAVLKASLRDVKLKKLKEDKNLDVDALRNAIRIQPVGESELLIVEIHHALLSRQEAAFLLNKVIDAYLQEIVMKDKLVDIEALDKMRKHARRLSDLVKKNADEVREQGQELGGVDNAQVALLQSIKLEKINHLQRNLTELELERIKQRELGEEAQEAIVDAQIEALTRQHEETMDEVQKLGLTWGEIDARTTELKALRASLETLRRRMLDKELEMSGPERVTVIQRAQ